MGRTRASVYLRHRKERGGGEGKGRNGRVRNPPDGEESHPWRVGRSGQRSPGEREELIWRAALTQFTGQATGRRVLVMSGERGGEGEMEREREREREGERERSQDVPSVPNHVPEAAASVAPCLVTCVSQQSDDHRDTAHTSVVPLRAAAVVNVVFVIDSAALHDGVEDGYRRTLGERLGLAYCGINELRGAKAKRSKKAKGVSW